MTFDEVMSQHYGTWDGERAMILDQGGYYWVIATGKPDDPDIANTRYISIKPELRYIFSNERATIKGYFGLQASYANRRWTNSGSGSYYEHASIRDSSISFSSAPGIALTWIYPRKPFSSRKIFKVLIKSSQV